MSNVTYNPGHNILALFNNLAQVRIATSKTIQNHLWLSISGNIRKMSNLGGDAA